MENNMNGWYTDSIGTKRHYRNGECHREDGPAVIYPDGSMFWYRNGELHREDGPAIINRDGSQGWYLNDKCHREDGPAISRPNGYQAWYLKGKEVRMEAVLDTPEKMETYLLEESLRRL